MMLSIVPGCATGSGEDSQCSRGAASGDDPGRSLSQMLESM